MSSYDPLTEQVPLTAEPVEVFTALAARHGLIREGDKMDQNLLDMVVDVVQLCARIGDGYGDGEAGGNAGEHIRAVYYPSV